MSFSFINAGRQSSSGVFSIVGAGAAAGDLMIVFPLIDGGGGSTSVSINSVVQTIAATTGYNWNLGGAPGGVYNEFAILYPLSSGFATSYTVTSSPAAANGIEVCWVIWRSSLGALTAANLDFAIGNNPGSAGWVNATNPGGTASTNSTALTYCSFGQNPNTNPGATGFTNRVYAFGSLGGSGVDDLDTNVITSIGATGIITAPGTQSTNNGENIVVALKEVASSPVTPSGSLLVQQRAKGFPTNAPLPGIALLGQGLLRSQSPVQVVPVYPAGVDFNEFFGAITAVVTPPPYVPTLSVQQRAPGFPIGAPMPGIAILGEGLLVAPQPSGVTPLFAYPGGISADSLLGALAMSLQLAPAGTFTSEGAGASAFAPTIAPAGSASHEGAGAMSGTPQMSLVGIAPNDAMGAQAFVPILAPSGLSSDEGRGASAAAGALAPAGMLTLEVLGAIASAQVSSVNPAGLGTEERFGAAALTSQVAPGNVPTADALGAIGAAAGLAMAGIASGEQAGAVRALLVIPVQPSAIDTLEQFGALALSLAAAPAGIVSAETSGAMAGTAQVRPGGMASEERSGASGFAVVVLPGGIVPLEGAGASALALWGGFTGISTDERFGAATLGTVVMFAQPAGVETAEAFGSVATATGAFPGAIASLEASGAMHLGIQILAALPAGIDSGEDFGAFAVGSFIRPAWIADEERFGAARIGPPTVTVVYFRGTSTVTRMFRGTSTTG